MDGRATGRLEAGAWILGAILFVWQVPHFLALAWMYRDDYARGGFRMLPARDRDGSATCQAIMLYSLALIPVTLMLSVIGLAGWVYAVGASALGCMLVAFSWQLGQVRDDLAARRVFLASVIYLPLLMLLMLVDRVSTPAGNARVVVAFCIGTVRNGAYGLGCHSLSSHYGRDSDRGHLRRLGFSRRGLGAGVGRIAGVGRLDLAPECDLADVGGTRDPGVLVRRHLWL